MVEFLFLFISCVDVYCVEKYLLYVRFIIIQYSYQQVKIYIYFFSIKLSTLHCFCSVVFQNSFSIPRHFCIFE